MTIEGQGGDVLLNGDTENYTGENGYTTHSITRDHSKGITVLLGQPYIINCIRMLLWDKDNRFDVDIMVMVLCSHTHTHAVFKVSCREGGGEMIIA